MSRFGRIGVLLLTIVFMFSLAVGCGSKDEDDTTTTTTTKKADSGNTTTTAAPTSEEDELGIPVINDGEPITLMVELNSLNPTLDEVPTAEQPEVRNASRELAREFMDIHPNVTVEYVYKSGNSWTEWMTTLMAAGDLPDICHMYAPDGDYHFVLNDALEEPNEYYPEVDRWKDVFPEYMWKKTEVLDRVGNIGTIPLGLNPGPATGYYYNKEIFAELNLEVPKTWEELLHVMEVCKEEGYAYFPYGADLGLGAANLNSWDFQFSIGPLMTQWAVDNTCIDYNGDGYVVYLEQLRFAYEGHTLFSDPDNAYMLEYFRQLRRKASLYPDGYANLDYGSMWLNGELAFREDGMWALPGERANTERGFEFGMFPPPVITKVTMPYTVDVEYVKGPYQPSPIEHFTVIHPDRQNRPMAHAEAAIQFLKFMSVPENLERVVLELKGSVLGAVKGCAIPPELAEWCENEFPILPNQPFFKTHFDSDMGDPKVIGEMYFMGMIEEDEFITRMDEEIKKDVLGEVELVVEEQGVDISDWVRGW